MRGTVLILGGSGKIGSHSAEAFWNAGWTVRQWRHGQEDMAEAARGADVIVNGLNPPGYHDWANQIPAITAQVVAAAKASGATVIVPGNVYTFGDVGGVWDETTPHRPVSRNGRIRAEMEEAYRASGGRTIVLRAGNFLDSAGNGDTAQLLLLRQIGRGRIVTPGDPDTMQAWAWVPDWARAAVALARVRAGLAPFEDVPFEGQSFTVAEYKAAAEAELMRPLTLARFPWWAMRAASPVWELGRELLEMRYLWSTPHRLSGDKLSGLVPDFRPTPFGEVVRGTLLAASALDVRPHQPVRTGGKASLA